jgi:hypothetical protein
MPRHGPKLPRPRLATRSRTTLTLNGRHWGVVVTTDKDGYTVEASGLPDLWAHAPTREAALAELSRQLEAQAASGSFPSWTPSSLDRRPDLRARFSLIVARALAQPVGAPVPRLVPEDDARLAGLIHPLSD